MPTKTRVHKETSRRAEIDEDAKATTTTTTAAGVERVTVADIDAILDEIDSVLEVNAEDFVRAFVQKGGEVAAVFLDTVARGFGVIAWRCPWVA